MSSNDQDDKLVTNRVGMSARRVGFGDVPAIIVVDLQTGLTHPEYSLGAELTSVIKSTNRVTAAANEADVPVFYTRHVPYPGGRRVGIWQKIDDIDILDPSRESGQLDDRLDIHESSTVIDKRQASAFHETSLNSILTGLGVDTVIVAGCSTSGCIRATTLGACSHGYRTIVPSSCVGDRSEEQQDANLQDIQIRIGDVVSTEDVIKYLQSN
mgnify:CR=1 FL=1